MCILKLKYELEECTNEIVRFCWLYKFRRNFMLHDNMIDLEIERKVCIIPRRQFDDHRVSLT